MTYLIWGIFFLVDGIFPFIAGGCFVLKHSLISKIACNIFPACQKYEKVIRMLFIFAGVWLCYHGARSIVETVWAMSCI
jgi:hypothetical protein